MSPQKYPYGETLSAAERQRWFEEEREAYDQLQPAKGYPYHEINRRYGFAHLPDRIFANVLAFGAGKGEELRSIANRIGHITLYESSPQMAGTTELLGKPCTYIPATADGPLPLSDTSIDLITCLGVLHHIAKVSAVLEDFFRMLTPGGFALIREPIVSMGDPSKPRKGLTPRERGLPLPWLLEQAASTGFQLHSKTLFQFLPFSLLCDKLSLQPYNSPLLSGADRTFCRIFPGSGRYHRTRLHHHLAPTSVFLVLQKPCASS